VWAVVTLLNLGPPNFAVYLLVLLNLQQVCSLIIARAYSSFNLCYKCREALRKTYVLFFFFFLITDSTDTFFEGIETVIASGEIIKFGVKNNDH
jgi:hypothetical protein